MDLEGIVEADRLALRERANARMAKTKNPNFERR
jgi:hypothetical protein